MSTATVGAFPSASLYVGDLNNDVNETTLFEMFSQVGPVASIRVCRDAVSRRSLGYAYVNFHAVTDAERALDTLNFALVKNRPCRIMWSQRDPSIRKSGVGNIFIKNLEKSIDNKALYDTFSMFGNILSAKIALSREGESLGYGFVHFDSDEAASKAIEKVNGMLLQDRKVIVNAFMPRDQRPTPKKDFSNIYVNELPDNCEKEHLDAFFSQYGEITASVVRANKDGKRFGFVNFGTIEQARNAVENASKTLFDGKTLFVCRAQKKTEREKELRSRYELIKKAAIINGGASNLYVKNLADEVDDDALRNLFLPYGAITSVKVMRETESKESRSRGFGFVCYAQQEDATRAVTELHGKIIGVKPLYVALAVRKDVRRAQLEALRQKGMMPGMYPGAPGPMFYGPGPGMPRPGFMYHPSQMMPRGPYGGRPPFPMQGPRGQLPYALVPAMQGVPNMIPGGGRGGPRPPRVGGPNQGAPRAMQGGRGGPVAGGARPGQGNVRYNSNARNNKGVEGGAAQPTENSLANLSSVPPEMQKQMLGEKLFPLIAAKQPEQAGKITGMLLEMENAELLELLEVDEALTSKVNEALIVLRDSAGESA